jgi:hypothetical protein
VKFGGEIPLDDLLVRLPAACPWCDDWRGSEAVLGLRDLVPGRKRYRVSLIAAVLRRLQYSTHRAVLFRRFCLLELRATQQGFAFA